MNPGEWHPVIQWLLVLAIAAGGGWLVWRCKSKDGRTSDMLDHSNEGSVTELIFDAGMYDGSDTEYYLETGHKVVAVEAHPGFCAAARKRFAKYIDAGQLIIENFAISNTPGTIDLHVSGEDPGSCSTIAERVEGRIPMGTYTARTITYDSLMAKHGKPMLLKIDIEGADKECVLSLTHKTAPPYLSFEAHHDIEALIDHCHSAGYRQFKIIHQSSFRCIQNQECLSQRIRMKLVRLAGFDKPLTRRINGRWHVLGHSAGPAPWDSDGRWYSRNEILAAWKSARRSGWYDVHAATRTAEAPVSMPKAIGKAYAVVFGIMTVIGLIIAAVALIIFR